MKNETNEQETERRGTSALTRLLAPREIKFRAWNTDYKEMEYGIVDIGIYENYLDMQWTGLQDENGKDIYEGDIVCVLDNRSYVKKVGIIKFKCGSFYIDCDGYSMYRLADYEMTIHGNVFETPELLE